MAKVFLYDALNVVQNAGKEAIYSISEGDEQRMMLLGLKRFTKISPYNLKEARRKIADHFIEQNGWNL